MALRSHSGQALRPHGQTDQGQIPLHGHPEYVMCKPTRADEAGIRERLMDKPHDHPVFPADKEKERAESADKYLNAVFNDSRYYAWKLVKKDKPEEVLGIQIFSWHEKDIDENDPNVDEQGQHANAMVKHTTGKCQPHWRHEFSNLPHGLRGKGLGKAMLTQALDILESEHDAPVFATIAHPVGFGVFKRLEFIPVPGYDEDWGWKIRVKPHHYASAEEKAKGK
ncbi:MAG: hypothetical protein Q9162_003562 [Coniocarpon cinnabarinum]